MATTPNYGWPTPEYGEATDIPVDMGELATAIDTTVKAVSDRVDSHSHPYLSLAGGTLTGPVSGVTPTVASHLTRKDYVDSKVAAASKVTYGPGDPPTSGMKAGDVHLKYE